MAGEIEMLRHLTSRKLVRSSKVDRRGKAAGMIRPDLNAPTWTPLPKPDIPPVHGHRRGHFLALLSVTCRIKGLKLPLGNDAARSTRVG